MEIGSFLTCFPFLASRQGICVFKASERESAPRSSAEA